MADTHGIQRDELHKKSIAAQIHEYIATVSAVLILANGSVPRITVGMDYALSALSALFPRTLARNIAFLFTNSPTYLSLNFSEDAIPEILKDAPQFLFDNPIALQRKYLELKDDPSKKKLRTELRRTVKSAEQQALEMFVDLFNWLDCLEPQPTTEIVALYEKSQAIDAKITNTLAQMDQAAAKMAEIKKLMEELHRKSAVSRFSLLAPCARVSCSLDVVHTYFFQLRKNSKRLSLEAAARFHPQLSVHRAELLFHLRCGPFCGRCFISFSEAALVVLQVQTLSLVPFSLTFYVGTSGRAPDVD